MIFDQINQATILVLLGWLAACGGWFVGCGGWLMLSISRYYLTKAKPIYRLKTADYEIKAPSMVELIRSIKEMKQR